MPISSLADSLAMTYLQQLMRGMDRGRRDTGDVGGGFVAIPDPSGPITARRRPGPSTLNDMVSGSFFLPGNRGIQGQLLRMLGNALQPNSGISPFGTSAAQFPEFVVPMFKQSP